MKYRLSFVSFFFCFYYYFYLAFIELEKTNELYLFLLNIHFFYCWVLKKGNVLPLIDYILSLLYLKITRKVLYIYIILYKIIMQE